MSLQICIMTPDYIYYNEPANEVLLPTPTGQMGVLRNHAPIITSLSTGVMAIKKQKDTNWVPYAIMGGFALIQKNQVTILVNDAESHEILDQEKVQLEYELASQKRDQAESKKEKIEAALVYERAFARYQTLQFLSANKYK